MTVGVNILMAVYNGERFIGEQIESIINQTYKNWKLFIRDDGSSDSTLQIVFKYQKLDKRIKVITDNLGNLKSCRNFSVLMNNIDDDCNYIMFSDQDDVWLPNKIEATLKEMIGVETKYGHDFPLLVYTNFMYVTETLQPIEAKKDYNATKVRNLALSHIIAQNPVYGCTMMINKKLLNIVGDIPELAENHDYWIALVASAFGKIFQLDEKTILYRQHGKNISGHHDNDMFLKRVNRIIINKRNFEDVRHKIKMAVYFRDIYSDCLNKSQRKIVNDFVNFSDTKNISLFLRNIKNGVRRQTFTQTVLFYVTIFFLKKDFRETALAKQASIRKS